MSKYTDPYPGLAPFTEKDVERFFGRDTERRQLSEIIGSEQLTLLYARSGVGKTSLLQAGVSEELRKHGCFPIVARFPRDERPVVSILNQVRREAGEKKVEIKNGDSTQSLWEFFTETEFRRGDVRLHPVLILDQFEELFTIVRLKRTNETNPEEDFVNELGDLLGGRVPQRLKQNMLERLNRLTKEKGGGKETPERQRLLSLLYEGAIPDVKVLISIREDYLSELDQLQRRLPAIFRNSFRLNPLSLSQAHEAIFNPSTLAGLEFTFEGGVIEGMIDFLRKKKVGEQWIAGDTIDPYVLQILCQHFNDRIRTRQGKNRKILLSDLGGEKGMEQIKKNYYDTVLKKIRRIRLGWNSRRYRPSPRNLLIFNLPRATARHLCEDGLIMQTGNRNSLAETVIEKNYGVSKSDITLLGAARLIREEQRLDTKFYELSHDVWLTPLNEKKSLRRQKLILSFVIVLTMLAMAFLPIVSSPSSSQVHPPLQSFFGIGLQWVNTTKLRSTVRDTSRSMDDRLQAMRILSEYLKWKNFQRIDFTHFNFRDARLQDMDFGGSPLTGALFQMSKIEKTNFSGARLDSANFLAATLTNCTLPGASLIRADLSWISILNGDMSQANLSSAFLTKASVTNSSLDGALLQNANANSAVLTSDTLTRANLSSASLFDVDFRYSDLSFADFSYAYVARASFDQTIIDSANFQGSDWWFAYGWTDEQFRYLASRFTPESFARTKRFDHDIELWSGEVQKARTNTEKAIRLNSLAWYRATHGGDLKVAFAEIERSLSYDGNNGDAIDTKGYIFLSLGQYANGKSEFTRARKFYNQSGLGERTYHLALAEEFMGNLQEAQKLFTEARAKGYVPSYERLLTPSRIPYKPVELRPGRSAPRLNLSF